MSTTANWTKFNLVDAMRKAGYEIEHSDVASITAKGNEGYGRALFDVVLTDGRTTEVVVNKEGTKAYTTTSSALPTTPLQQFIRSALGVTERGGVSAMKKSKFTKNYKESSYHFITWEHALTPFFTTKEEFEEKLVKAAEAGGYKVKSAELEQIWTPNGPKRMVTFTIKTMCPYVI